MPMNADTASADTAPFSVTFWGVRGSIASPGPSTVRYGGNTSCLEVRCGDSLLIFDAGTGIRELGEALSKSGAVELDLFFTHTHFDHICGLPFFAPAYAPKNKLRLWAGHLPPGQTLRRVVSDLMSAPLFPVPVEIMSAAVEFREFAAGAELRPAEGVVLRTSALNHPNGAVGYRIDFGGRAICYITDTEHCQGKRDQTIINLVRGADVMIYDCTYTDAEYPGRVGWGHSTWEECLRLAEAAGVATPVIFHHDPTRDDDALDRLAAAAAAINPAAVVAREGLTITV
jgi:phosphoribosyl 1,2-cyclic phosphodiesterase